MNEHLTEIKLRQFLLGDIQEEERAQIERLFISDPRSKERILVAEEDLIEDYLEGSLSPDQKQKFLAQYGYTPRRLRRLEITRLIRKHAMASGLSVAIDVEAPQRRSVFAQLWPRNIRILVPAFALLFVAIIAGVIC